MKDEDRKVLLEMARRRAKPGSGSSLRALRESTSHYGEGGILPSLQGLKYAVVGGLATARYMPERMTLDTDILIEAGDLAKAERSLRVADCERLGSPTIGGSTWRMPEGRNVDVIALDKPWVQIALDAAIRDEEGVPFIDLPYLVLMKLASGRLQDLADIGRMLGGAGDGALDATRRLIARFQPQDVDDLESMISLGKLEYE